MKFQLTLMELNRNSLSNNLRICGFPISPKYPNKKFSNSKKTNPNSALKPWQLHMCVDLVQV